MKEITLRVTTKSDEIAVKIMNDLAKYDCNYRLIKDEEKKYSYLYENMPYTKLGDVNSVTSSQVRKDIKYYDGVGKILSSYGINSNHSGFKYIVECVRLINSYGIEKYVMNDDIYSVISKWYNVSPASIEHNIRNSINYSWDRYESGEEAESEMQFFKKKPTNTKFLRHIAKISNYIIAEAYIMC